MARGRSGSLTAASLAAFDVHSVARRPPQALSDVSTDTDNWSYEDQRSDTQGSVSDSPARKEPFDHAIPSRCGNFDLIAEHQLDPAYDSPLKIAKWRSKKTGLSVVWANTPGPLVKSWTTVVSEIFDDSGRPHTLEHLVFMGSAKYPYKGVLDQIGNRCLSSGGNAWTGVDNTTFTISTVGEQAMLQILPVYLDHIFNPSLTDAAFTTEVYHVDATGHEGGVVFSEMQARSGSSGDLLELRMQQILYDSRNGYRSETGGMLDALRHLKNEQIKEYHASAYVPQNATLLVCGEAMDPLRLLGMLNDTVEIDLERQDLARGPHPRGWQRPFVETSSAQNPPQLPKNEKEVVFYPEKDESVGEVRIHWIGPPARDLLLNGALAVLGEFLSRESTSPLNVRFVEGKDPGASDISFTSDIRGVSLLHCLVSSVPSKKLGTIADDILRAIAELAQAPFDMKRMRDVLQQERLATLSVVEGASATWVQQNVMQDILYGPEDGSGLAEVFDDLHIFDQLEKWTAKDWLELLHDYFVARPSLILIGKPSRSLAEKKAAEDAAVVAATRERLGPEGLAARGDVLRLAEAQNAKPVPVSLLKSFKIPSLKGLHWIKIQTALARGISQQTSRRFKNPVQDYVDRDVSVPLFLEFEHFPTRFVEFVIYMQSPRTHPLLSLFLSSFFSLPVTRANGRTLSHEDVAKELQRTFVWYSIHTVAEGVALSARVAADKYETAIAWFADLLSGAVFDVERLINAVVTSLQDLPAAREDDSSIASAGHQLLILSEDSVLWPCNILNLLVSLPKLLKRLRADPEGVVRDLRELRHDLTDPRAMRVSVQGDILALREPTKPWTTHFLRLAPFPISKLEPVKAELDLLSSLGQRPARKMDIFRSPSSSGSTYSRHMARGLPMNHPDFPALQIAVSALNATEGYLWNAVRGPGLAYGANIGVSPNTREITFVIYRSPDAFAAFTAARKLVESLVSGKVALTQEAVDAAKSTYAFGEVACLQTPSDVADNAFGSEVIHQRSRNTIRDVLAETESDKCSDVRLAIRKWILPLFDPATSIAVVSTGAGQAEHLAASFKKLGFVVEEKST